jgi:hypothetical protein
MEAMEKTEADTYRLPAFRQEPRYRHFWEWAILAEDQESA